MSQTEEIIEKIALSIMEEKYLRKDELKIKLKVLVKAMFETQGAKRRDFKQTTLDWVSSIAQKNKFKSNFWREKVEELCPEKMKLFHKELSQKMQNEDFRSNRLKKLDQGKL